VLPHWSRLYRTLAAEERFGPRGDKSAMDRTERARRGTDLGSCAL
jgi:hypothetical protein